MVEPNSPIWAVKPTARLRGVEVSRLEVVRDRLRGGGEVVFQEWLGGGKRVIVNGGVEGIDDDVGWEEWRGERGVDEGWLRNHLVYGGRRLVVAEGLAGSGEVGVLDFRWWPRKPYGGGGGERWES
ncbi:hypothetical protein Tco_0902690 [Tanacetum coccineum]